MGRTGAKVKKGGLGDALLRTQKKTSPVNTKDVASSAGKHVSERDGGDASVALASYLEGSSLVRYYLDLQHQKEQSIADKMLRTLI